MYDHLEYLIEKKQKIELLENAIKNNELNQTLMVTLESVTMDDFFVNTKKMFVEYPTNIYTKSTSNVHLNLALESAKTAIDDILSELIKVILVKSLKPFKVIYDKASSSIVTHVKITKMSDNLKKSEPFLEQLETVLKQYNPNFNKVLSNTLTEFDKFDGLIKRPLKNQISLHFMDRTYKSQEMLINIASSLLNEYRRLNKTLTALNSSIDKESDLYNVSLDISLLKDSFVLHSSEISLFLKGIANTPNQFYPQVYDALTKNVKNLKYTVSLENFKTIYYTNDRVDLLSDFLKTYEKIVIEASFVPTLFTTFSNKYNKLKLSEETSSKLYTSILDLQSYVDALSIGQKLLDDLDYDLAYMVKAYEGYTKAVSMVYKNGYKECRDLGNEVQALSLKSFSQIQKLLTL